MGRPYRGPNPTEEIIEVASAANSVPNSAYSFAKAASTGCEPPKTCDACTECSVFVWKVGCTSEVQNDGIYGRQYENFGAQTGINITYFDSTFPTDIAAAEFYGPPSGETTLVPDEYWCGSGINLVFVEQKLFITDGKDAANYCQRLKLTNDDYEFTG